ncbi:transglutaminase-like cysteine peptidase [Consotaella aegiceratis]|uniref:transglutaminase-like cysteine peptidase n=1 Tax=Consotaella aegiceratis TaxID=3097961 RepID=UPI002F42B204
MSMNAAMAGPSLGVSRHIGSIARHALQEKLDSRPGFGERGQFIRISANRPTLAPFAYVKLCMTSPRDCRGGGSEIARIDDKTFSRVDGINRSVNRSIRPRNERGDTWQADVKAGDCEDYALTKRRRLIEMGLPASAMRMAVVKTGSGEGHAVLVVRSNRGDLVLDNRTNAIREWYKTGLVWLKVQSGSDPSRWYTL